MTTQLKKPFGLGLLLALLCLPCLALAASESEEQFRAKFFLDPSTILKFADEKGAPINQAEFSKQTRAGKRFELMKSKDSEDSPVTATFQLEAPPTPKAQSKPAVAPSAPKSKLIGKPLPAFKLLDRDGKTVTNEDLPGRPTLINFFFAECLPCILETPMLNAYQAKRKDLRMLAITFDDKATIDKYVRKHKFAWQSLVDAKSFIDQAGVQAFPSFVLLDAKGIVKAVQAHPDFALVEEKGAIKAVALQSDSSTGSAKAADLHDPRRLDEWVTRGLVAN